MQVFSIVKVHMVKRTTYKGPERMTVYFEKGQRTTRRNLANCHGRPRTSISYQLEVQQSGTVSIRLGGILTSIYIDNTGPGPCYGAM